ncbi:thioredoxin family protein [Taibaiella sp. KBW10]|uniref:thioredoxin family protein n=1 Tax=Taibaiella sp. KBW10 TaxID=2153357 RepID=UPI000F59B6E1|nr:thioredoxin family protein [Taibaiella sp. KBW10]RQO31467.1 thioredoxin family protein [Taibaiella sp. KBW10]
MNIFKTALRNFDYTAFMQYAEEVITHNEAKDEKAEDEKYAFYTKLNYQRMKRWNKTFVPREDLITKLKAKPGQNWWLITEAWCGDSAQNLPVIAALAEAAAIPLTIVLRDENEAIINQYLTNGTKSIPVLVCFNDQDEMLFRWGPRPEGAQALMNDWKADPKGRDFEAFELEMHQWYTKDKGSQTQDELADLV